MHANASSHANRLHSYVATDVEPVQKQNLDDYEEIEVVLMPLQKLVETLDSDAMFPASLHACVFNALRTLKLVKID